MPDTRTSMSGAGADDAATTIWGRQLLEFWFSALDPADWFRKNSAVDDEIARRFADLPDAVAEEAAASHLQSAADALAAVIALDQLPRNLHRGTARAFAYDATALELARAAVAKGLDAQLTSTNARLFLYLPFEHSETKADQEQSLALVAALGSAIYTDYAHRHKDVIDRFGRFPHRNAALDRASTSAEMAYLAEPGSGF